MKIVGNIITADKFDSQFKDSFEVTTSVIVLMAFNRSRVVKLNLIRPIYFSLD